MAKTDEDFSLLWAGRLGAAAVGSGTIRSCASYYVTEWGMPVRDERACS
jgi:hypothetical protein